MSIIEKTNPLNLQYKVCVVTNASTPLGVVVCKTLLKANALVLGIDKNARDHSLNAGLGTHFQFEERDLSDPEAPQAIIEASREKFESLGGKFDALVNLVGEDQSDLDGIKALTKAIGTAMREAGQGSIITVPGTVKGNEEVRSKALLDFTKDLTQQYESTSIRTNVIVPDPTRPENQQSAKAYEQAKEHMTALMKTERPAKDVPPSKQTPPKFYQVGNLTLFLAGGMGEQISGKIVSLDGSYRGL
ncbi:putative short-chain dehydrogenase/reductase SDR, NAD(P)-binding domain superfamily [Septoria linicola]|nr:putative short-chain dehydrogenase/reductase SDR, NAD(P)-binding domain superfamily [Septoria linicola]